MNDEGFGAAITFGGVVTTVVGFGDGVEKNELDFVAVLNDEGAGVELRDDVNELGFDELDRNELDDELDLKDDEEDDDRNELAASDIDMSSMRAASTYLVTNFITLLSFLFCCFVCCWHEG